MTGNRVVVLALVVLAGVALLDALRRDPPREPVAAAGDDLVIDLSSSRDATDVATASLRGAFPGPDPGTLAVSKVAAAPDGVVAVGVSSVPGDERARAAVELWRGGELLSSFAVPAGAFSRGLWFAGEGRALAATGWDGRSRVWDRAGRSVRARAYVAYETG